MTSNKTMTIMKPIALAGVALFVTSKASNAQTTTTLATLFVSANALEEEKPDGANGEPPWVRNRRFSTTRIYIQQDPGEIGFEQWYRVRTFDGGQVTQRSQTEFEIGLPYRMQLDLYENAIHDNADNRGWQQEEVAVELRYAFADWGKIPLNPTLYFEYAFCHEGADGIEPKLLIGDDFGKDETGRIGERIEELEPRGRDGFFHGDFEIPDDLGGTGRRGCSHGLLDFRDGSDVVDENGEEGHHKTSGDEGEQGRS